MVVLRESMERGAVYVELGVRFVKVRCWLLDRGET